MDVYILQHVHQSQNDQDDVKIIGIFDSIKSADEARRVAQLLPGFKEPDGEFFIDKYALNKSYWEEGFGISDD